MIIKILALYESSYNCIVIWRNKVNFTLVRSKYILHFYTGTKIHTMKINLVLLLRFHHGVDVINDR